MKNVISNIVFKQMSQELKCKTNQKDNSKDKLKPNNYNEKLDWAGLGRAGLTGPFWAGLGWAGFTGLAGMIMGSQSENCNVIFI